MKPETIILTDGSEVTLVHFLFLGRIACMPGLDNLAASGAPNAARLAPHVRTEDPRGGVTCPHCLKSEEFKRTEAEHKRILATSPGKKR